MPVEFERGSYWIPQITDFPPIIGMPHFIEMATDVDHYNLTSAYLT